MQQNINLHKIDQKHSKRALTTPMTFEYLYHNFVLDGKELTNKDYFITKYHNKILTAQEKRNKRL